MGEQHLIRADLHFHTKYSPDATNRPKTIVKKLNSHPIIKAIAITDHNTLEGYRQVKELAKAFTDNLIIPGIEISAEEGEIIILGTTEVPQKPWRVQEIIDDARENGSITIAPHPYRGLGLGDQAFQLKVDAIETLNGITAPDLNRRAAELAKIKNLPGVAGSDSHFERDPWNVCTEIQSLLNVDDVLDAIRRRMVTASPMNRSIRF